MSVPEQNSQSQPVTEQKTNDKEYNFAQLRKQLEQERQARQQYEQRLAQMEQERQAPRQDYDNDDDDSEPYVDKKALKKHLSKWEQSLDQKIDQKAEEKARLLVEQERQNSYLRQNPDFHQTLQAEHIQKFAEKYPQIAEPMLEMPDGFARQKLLYEQIKALGVNRKEEPKPSIQETINNNRKPIYYQPSQSGTQPPYAAAGDFSASGQKNAYDKMKQLINNRRAF